MELLTLSHAEDVFGVAVMTVGQVEPWVMFRVGNLPINIPSADNSSQIQSNVNAEWSRNSEMCESLDGLGVEIEYNLSRILDSVDEELTPVQTVSTPVNNVPLPIPQAPVRNNNRRNGDNQRATSSIAQPLFTTTPGS